VKDLMDEIMLKKNGDIFFAKKVYNVVATIYTNVGVE
jgi:hypothetical protein